MNNVLTKLAFVPDMVGEHFSREVVSSGGASGLDSKSKFPSAEPFEKEMSGTVMIADISGFTKLAEYYCTMGDIGVEKLSLSLNVVFSLMINTVEEHGGDIIKFAGDAIICFWKYEDNMVSQQRRAIQCALSMVNAIAAKIKNAANSVATRSSAVMSPTGGDAAASKKPADDVFENITVHLGLGEGSGILLHVGGFRNRYEFLITGSSISDASISEGNAKSMEVCVSKSMWESVSTYFKGKPREAAASHGPPVPGEDHSSILVTSCEVPLDTKVNYRTALLDYLKKHPAAEQHMNDSLTAFLPKPIALFLSSLDETSAPLAEIRFVTTLFIKLGEYSDAVGKKEPGDFSTAMIGSPMASGTAEIKPKASHKRLKESSRTWSSFVDPDRASKKGSRLTTASTGSEHESGKSEASHPFGIAGHDSTADVLDAVRTTPKTSKKRMSLATIGTPTTTVDTDASAPAAAGLTLQTVFLQLQQAVAERGGMIRQLLVDDKGLVLIVVFGVREHAFRNNAERAVSAALAIQAKLALTPYGEAHIGLASGDTFCGTVGNNSRSEYAIVGDSVNLAARLMAKAGNAALGLPTVLCEIKTVNKCFNTFEFMQYASVMVKGKTEPIAIYHPRELHREKRVPLANSIQSAVDLVGQHDLKQLIVTNVDDLLTTHMPGGIAISGPSGVGKTAFLRYCANINVLATFNSGIFLLPCSALEEEKNTAYYIFRQILRAILKLQPYIYKPIDRKRQCNYIKFQLGNLGIGSSSLHVRGALPNTSLTLSAELPEDDSAEFVVRDPSLMKFSNKVAPSPREPVMATSASPAGNPNSRFASVKMSKKLSDKSKGSSTTLAGSSGVSEGASRPKVRRGSESIIKLPSAIVSEFDTEQLRKNKKNTIEGPRVYSGPGLSVIGSPESKSASPTTERSHAEETRDPGVIGRHTSPAVTKLASLAEMRDSTISSAVRIEDPDDLNSETSEETLDMLVPLIVNVLDSELDNSKQTLSKISKEMRAKQTQDLLFKIIERVKPYLIIIDNANFIDTQSCELLSRLYKSGSLMVIASVTSSVDIEPHTKQLLDEMNLKKHQMGMLSESDIGLFISSTLQMTRSRISDELASIVYTHSNGHPLWAREVVNLLSRTKAIVTTADGVVTVDAAKAGILTSLETKDSTLKELILERFDAISSTEQSILKAASVIGSMFSLSLLRRLMPLQLVKNETLLDDYLDKLVDAKFIKACRPMEEKGLMEAHATDSSSAVYEFDSNFIRHCVYSLIPFTIKQTHHRKIARALANTFADNLEPVFPLIAFHYENASDFDKAFKNYEMASKASFYMGYQAKGVSLLQKALTISDKCTFCEYENYKPYKLVEWNLLASEALMALGQESEAVKYYQAALELVRGNEELLKDKIKLAATDLTSLKPRDAGRKGGCVIA